MAVTPVRLCRKKWPEKQKTHQPGALAMGGIQQRLKSIARDSAHPHQDARRHNTDSSNKRPFGVNC
jgi:hypothetical protein